MTHHFIDRFSRYRRIAFVFAMAFSVCFLLIGCASKDSATDEAPFSGDFHENETVSDVIPSETLPLVETGIPVASQEETADMSSMIQQAQITVTQRDGILGDFDFFTCNETQLFGDFSICLAEYDGQEYFMLSHNGLILLAREDGSNAKLFYQDQMLELPFPCHFLLDYEFLGLHTGDFLQTGGHQLAMVIPMDTGSGVDVDQLQIIDLDTLSIVSIHTENASYPQEIRQLFDDHFAQIHPGVSYELFQYVQYYVQDGLIFAEYGACDEDGNYLCFLEGSLSYDGSQMILDPQVTFQDHIH